MGANLISAQKLQRLIGLIALVLPFLLLLGVWLDLAPDDRYQPTMSEYVYTASQPIFTGTLFAIGVMLLCYVGYEGRPRKSPFTDARLADLSGLAAIITAIFPSDSCFERTNLFSGFPLASLLHFTGAATLFLTMSLFCIFHFTESGTKALSRAKIMRNWLFKIAGYAILLGMFLIALIKFVPANESCAAGPFFPVFWIEAAMCALFALAWLTKSKIFWPDAGPGRMASISG